jgi:hypothetical protein
MKASTIAAEVNILAKESISWGQGIDPGDIAQMVE